MNRAQRRSKAMKRNVAASKDAMALGRCGRIGPHGHVCTVLTGHEGPHKAIALTGPETGTLYATWGVE